MFSADKMKALESNIFQHVLGGDRLPTTNMWVMLDVLMHFLKISLRVLNHSELKIPGL